MTRYAQRTLIQQPSVANWGKAAPQGIGVVDGYGVATGGTPTTISVGSPAVSYTLLTFASDTNLVVSTGGLFDVYLIGGGGGGGGSPDGNSAGGGGAGQFVQMTNFLAAGTYTVDVGAAGSGGANGLLSSIGTTIGAAAGGRGGSYLDTGGKGENGGSGGGSTQGNSGGKALCLNANAGGGSSGNSGSGGGGGAGSAGGAGSGTTGGTAGNGVDVSTFVGGSTVYVAAGGGGGGTGTGGAAGSAGGVAGKTSGTGNNATVSGGGGGGTCNAGGGTGGTGRIFVRFKI